jgi:hypothetical protein
MVIPFNYYLRILMTVYGALMGKGPEAKDTMITSGSATVDAAKGQFVFQVMREHAIDGDTTG